MIEVGDAVVRLRDGRLLGYAVYGDPTGFPTLSCHGGLLCRLDASSADAAARDLGLCVISPDRPGISSAAGSQQPIPLDGEDHMIGITHRVRILRRLVESPR